MQYFSDGIIAIAITIIVLDLELTKFDGANLKSEWDIALELLPRFLIYLMSYAMLGIMWVNHHTLYRLIKYTDTKLLWHNLHFLFWLTIIPFSTSILGRYPSIPLTMATYALVMFMSSLAFSLSRHYVTTHDMIHQTKVKEEDVAIRKIINRMRMKINIGMFFYAIAFPLSFVTFYLTYICFIIPAILYIIPEQVQRKGTSKSLYEHLEKIQNF